MQSSNARCLSGFLSNKVPIYFAMEVRMGKWFYFTLELANNKDYDGMSASLSLSCFGRILFSPPLINYSNAGSYVGLWSACSAFSHNSPVLRKGHLWKHYWKTGFLWSATFLAGGFWATGQMFRLFNSIWFQARLQEWDSTGGLLVEDLQVDVEKGHASLILLFDLPTALIWWTMPSWWVAW